MLAYSEDHHAALWITGRSVEGSWAHPDEDSNFYQLAAYVGNIFRRIGLTEGMTVRKKSSNDIFADGIAIENRGGKLLAEMGVLSKKVQKAFDISNTVFYAELDWTALMKAVRKQKVEFTEISKYPAVSRDLALLLDKSIEFAQIEQIARQSEKRLLRQVELFDVYEGKNLPEGKKSYAVNFILQDPDKTLNDKAIEAVMNKIIQNLKKQLGAELR
jgi:phenylalanyl-tRNA synthetase beta chain